MADEVETDGAEAGGESPSPAETETTDGAAAESPSASDGEGTDASPATGTEASAEDEDQEFKNALNKHKGDKAAFGRHYWQTQQDNARIAKENADLRAKLAEHDTGRPRTEPKPAEPEPVDVSPELKELETYLGALEDEKKAFPKEQDSRIAAATTAWRTVVQLETKFEMADEFEKPALETKIALAKRELRDARQDVAEGERRRSAIEADIKKGQRERDSLKRQVESDKARQEQAKRDEKEFNQSFPQEVDAHIFSALDELKVPKGADPKADKLRESIWGSTNEALIVKFRRLGEQGVRLEDVDVPKLVRETTKSVVERYETYARGKFGLQSKDKLKVTLPAKTPPAKPGAGEPPKRPPLPYETEEEVDPRLLNARKRLASRGL